MDIERPEPEVEGGFMDAMQAIPDVARGLWNHPRETLGGMGAGTLEGVRQQTSPAGLANVAMTALPAAGMIKSGRMLEGAGELGGKVMGGLKQAIKPAWEAEQVAAKPAATLAESTRALEQAGTPMGGRGPISWGPPEVVPQAHPSFPKPFTSAYPNARPVGAGYGPQAFRTPKAGGVLEEVLTRAGSKSGAGSQGLQAGVGGAMTPGEQRLLDHYSKLIR